MGQQLNAFTETGEEMEVPLPSADTLEGNVFVKVLPTSTHYQLMYNRTGMFLCGGNILIANTWEEVYADIINQTKNSLTIIEDDKPSYIFVTIKITTKEAILYADKLWTHNKVNQKSIKFKQNVQDRDNT